MFHMLLHISLFVLIIDNAIQYYKKNSKLSIINITLDLLCLCLLILLKNYPTPYIISIILIFMFSLIRYKKFPY